MQTSATQIQCRIEDVVHGRRKFLVRESDGSFHTGACSAIGILSGAFNPLHAGHTELRAAARRRLGGPVWFELTIANADKPPLAVETVAGRMSQFHEAPLVISRAATFVEKARLFPQTAFVVGHDTAVRILHPRFYAHRENQLRAALNEIRDAGCRFLVAGRCDDTSFRTGEDLQIPPGYEALFDTLTESEFRRDLSSTELRQAR